MSSITLDNILAKLYCAGGAVQTYEILLRSLRKSLMALFLPMAILFGTYFVLQSVPKVHPAILNLYTYFPYAVLTVGLLLAWRFNRARAFFPLVLLSVCYWAIQSYVVGKTGLQSDVYFALMCLLVPVNYLIFVLLGERGIFTQRGIIRLVFIAAQVLMAVLLVRYALKPASEILYRIIDTSGWLPSRQVPQLAQPVFAFSLLVVVARVFQKRNAVEGGLAASLLSMALAFEYMGNQFVMISYFSVAAFVMVMTVIQDSWQMAYVDELTSLPGRRALNEQLLKLGQVYTIAMVDVDHFKKFNDTYGHDVGDQVLRYVAARMESVGSGGRAYRYGGEEFTLLFPGRPMAECTDALKRVHQAIGDSSFALRAKDRPKTRPESPVQSKQLAKGVQITVSIGVASCKNGDMTPREVIKQADGALYKAKGDGRNRIRS